MRHPRQLIRSVNAATGSQRRVQRGDAGAAVGGRVAPGLAEVRAVLEKGLAHCSTVPEARAGHVQRRDAGEFDGRSQTQTRVPRIVPGYLLTRYRLNGLRV